MFGDARRVLGKERHGRHQRRRGDGGHRGRHRRARPAHGGAERPRRRGARRDPALPALPARGGQPDAGLADTRHLPRRLPGPRRGGLAPQRLGLPARRRGGTRQGPPRRAVHPVPAGRVRHGQLPRPLGGLAGGRPLGRAAPLELRGVSARHPTRREAAAAAGLALAAAVAPPRRATGQTPQAAWPARPIRVIVPYAPGGTADTTARALGHAMAPRLGQPVVVENRSGATGAIGMEAAARAAPDGHTLVVAADPAIYPPYPRPRPPYHPLRDLAPVSVLVQQPIVVAAHPGLGVRTLAELVAVARARPGEVAYVPSGTASTHHLAAELLCRRAGIRMTHVPYRGGGQAINDLVAGQVGLGVLGSGPVVPPARAGRLRLLAVTPAARSPGLPEGATVAE